MKKKEEATASGTAATNFNATAKVATFRESRKKMDGESMVKDYISLIDCELKEKDSILSATNLGQGEHLPTCTMSSRIREYAEALERVYQIDVDFVTSSIYAAVAAAVGKRYVIEDRKGYKNTLALWMCHIAGSGYGKSPIESTVFHPIKKRDKELNRRYKEQMELYSLVKSKGSMAMDRPIHQRLYTSDCTPEALFQDLADNDGCLLLYRDELSGWVQDFGRYSKSGEIEHYLSLWSGQSVNTSRATKDGCFIESPCFNVFGGTQPDRLQKVFGNDVFLASGFDARMCWIFPQNTIYPSKYDTEKVDTRLHELWDGYVGTLLNLTEREVTFTDDAHQLYVNYWEALQKKKQEEEVDFMRQVYSKLQIIVEKWAGITFLLSGENIRADFSLAEIDGQSMRVAIEAMGLLEGWARKVYEKMQEGRKPKLTKEQAIRDLNEVYPIQNRQLFADALGIKRQQVVRALGKPDS